MGADHPPEQLAEGIVKALRETAEEVCLTLFISPESFLSVKKTLNSCEFQDRRVDFSIWPEVIAQNDEPLGALRKKRKSSLVQGIRALKRGKIQAFISCSNTGALFVSASLYLSRLSGIRRPALLAHVPTRHGQLAVLDVGSSLQCRASHLVSYAELGVFFKRIQGLAKPKVGLLNVGIESKKGTLEHQLAYDKLQSLALQTQLFEFVGNVEGRAIFQVPLDVLVTDGFTGNVFLKTLEGSAQFILQHLAETVEPAQLNRLKSQLSHTEYPGAILLGVEGIVMKCHGDATAHTLFQGIKKAVDYVEQQVTSRMLKERTEHPAFLSSLSDAPQGAFPSPNQ